MLYEQPFERQTYLTTKIYKEDSDINIKTKEKESKNCHRMVIQI